MNIEKINPNIRYLYHYTLKKNVEKILNDKAIISKDEYVFFTKSLQDSITAFEREIMQEGKLYIDVNGNLKKREKCNKDDYCILKIPYINDNKFYKFNFENQSKESIYTISISHKGAYKFEKAKVIEFPKFKKLNVLSSSAVAAIVAGIILFPHNTYAANWLDTDNYDIGWYTNAIGSNYLIRTEKELAGLAYLVNNEQEKFEDKDIEIVGDFDLTQNTWQTISDIFKGNICGSHRIILNYLDGDFIKNKSFDKVEYAFNVIENDNLKTINVKFPYTVEKLKEECSDINSRVIYNYEEISNDKSLFDLNLKPNDKILVISGLYIYIENENGEKELFKVESGDSIDNVKYKYSEKMNISTNKIIIKYNGKELEDGKTLADYNIQRGSKVQVYIKQENNETNTDKPEESTNKKDDKENNIKEETKNNTEVDNNKENIIDINADKEKNQNNINNTEKDEENNIKVTEDNIKQTEEKINPQTGDNIILYIITLCLSAFGIVLAKIKRKK